jgi:hypothetical protein
MIGCSQQRRFECSRLARFVAVGQCKCGRNADINGWVILADLEQLLLG